MHLLVTFLVRCVWQNETRRLSFHVSEEKADTTVCETIDVRKTNRIVFLRNLNLDDADRLACARIGMNT